MEPESRMYVCPVVVLDFQSLYPSMVIAYNLCYSTCLGRPAHAAASAAAAQAEVQARTGGTPCNGLGNGGGGGTPLCGRQAPPGAGVRLGVSAYAPPPGALLPGGAADPAALVIAPNGVAFVPHSVRPGVLPRLLHEILATRVMVKSAMKRARGDKVRSRVCAHSYLLPPPSPPLHGT